MGESIRRLVASPMLRAVAAAILAGIVVLTMTVTWQTRRQPTVIVTIQQIDDPAIVRVYIGGDVRQPGVVTLPRGSRVADAITAAGGTTETADISSLGMAAMLADSDQIIVPSIARIVVTSTAVVTPASSQSILGPTPPEDAAVIVTSAAIVQPVQGTSTLVDLNSADIAALDTLPGVGPSIAQRIIDYRTVEGPFQSVDELEDVRGISARMVDEMRPLVTVGS